MHKELALHPDARRLSPSCGKSVEGAGRPSRLHGLYAITPEGLTPVQLLDHCAQALRGGAQLLQYRDKSRNAAQQRDNALALRALCREHDAGFIVNDDVALALAVSADGVHLGADDGDLAAAREALGPQILLGASCYADFSLAQAAVAAGADYVAFGAVCPSPTKPQAVRAPLSLFARARRELAVPLCAIGGISVERAPEIIAAGADMLAVISDLFDAPDIAARARAFKHLFPQETSRE